MQGAVCTCVHRPKGKAGRSRPIGKVGWQGMALREFPSDLGKH